MKILDFGLPPTQIHVEWKFEGKRGKKGGINIMFGRGERGTKDLSEREIESEGEREREKQRKLSVN